HVPGGRGVLIHPALRPRRVTPDADLDPRAAGAIGRNHLLNVPDLPSGAVQEGEDGRGIVEAGRRLRVLLAGGELAEAEALRQVRGGELDLVDQCGRVGRRSRLVCAGGWS